MRSHAPFEPIVTKFCMWGRVGDLIADAEFFLKIGSGVSQLQNPPNAISYLYLTLIALTTVSALYHAALRSFCTQTKCSLAHSTRQ